MLRRIMLGLIMLIPSALSAQEGSIAFTHSVRLDFEMPEELRARIEARGGAGAVPTERVNDVILFFNDTESLMKPVPRAAPEGRPARGDFPGARRGDGFAGRLRMAGLGGRGAQEVLVEAHTRFEEGRIVESRRLLGRTFIIEDERPAFAWKLTGEQADFLGYTVQKATAVQDSTSIEAWFTMEIPVSGGPGVYGGLPGMILVVSVNDGETQYTATAVSMSEIADGVIVGPTDGESVTREEYDTIVAEKMEELRTTRGRIR